MNYYIVKPGGKIKECSDLHESAKWFGGSSDRLFEDGGRRVANTEFPGGLVSTVFLWIDHGHGVGPPVLFETMIFGGARFDEYQERYCTVEEARAGHYKAVALVMESDRLMKESN